jgi:hypothetical protein
VEERITESAQPALDVERCLTRLGRHITGVAGVTFLVASLIAVGVHSAGFWRVKSPD